MMIDHKKLDLRFSSAFFLFLAVSLFAIYAQVRHFGVLTMDDIFTTEYLSNPRFSVTYIIQSFMKTPDFSPYWNPLAVLSFIFDLYAFGSNIPMYRITHVILHILSSMLLFLMLYYSTGNKWRSAFAASIFALHPMNMEPVATLYGRTSILSGWVCITALLSYCYYASKPNIRKYLLFILMIILVFVSKPSMLIIFFVLPLLDYWPLERFFVTTDRYIDPAVKKGSHRHRFNKLVVVDKIPIIVMGMIWLVFTAWYYQGTQYPGFVDANQSVLGWPAMLIFIPISYVAYVWKTICPAGLPAYYSPLFHGDLPLWLGIGAIVLLVAITVAITFLARKKLYFVTGWFWFMGTLLPHVLIAVSQQTLVIERYAYIPLIGLFLIIAWAGGDIANFLRIKRSLIVVISVSLLLFWGTTTWKQVKHRRDAISFYRHALDIYPGYSAAHSNLGELLLSEGKLDEAISCFNKAIQVDPSNAIPYSHLGDTLVLKKEPEKAVFYYQLALRIKPDYITAHNNLANLLLDLGEVDEAITHYEVALRIDPNLYATHNNLATALILKGRSEERRVGKECRSRWSPYH